MEIEAITSTGKKIKVDISKIAGIVTENILERRLYEKEQLTDIDLDDIMFGENGVDLVMSDMLPPDVRVDHEKLSKMIRSISKDSEDGKVRKGVEDFLVKTINENNEWRSDQNKKLDIALSAKLP